MNGAPQPEVESSTFDAEAFKPLIYNAQFPFIFCGLCRGGYLVTSIRIHMAQHHAKELSVVERRRLCDIADSLPNMAQNEVELRRIFRPQTMRKALPYLKAAEYEGLKCKMCGYMCRLRLSIKQHMRKYHEKEWAWRERCVARDWEEAGALDSVLWRKGVKFQQLFRKPRYQCLVEVCDDEVLWE